MSSATSGWHILYLGGGGTKEVRLKNHVRGCLDFAKEAKIFSQECKTICEA